MMAQTSFARGGKLTIKRAEIVNIYDLLGIVDGNDIADCKNDDDCGDGMICVGIGICVPEADQFQLKRKLPKLMKRVAQ